MIVTSGSMSLIVCTIDLEKLGELTTIQKKPWVSRGRTLIQNARHTLYEVNIPTPALWHFCLSLSSCLSFSEFTLAKTLSGITQSLPDKSKPETSLHVHEPTCTMYMYIHCICTYNVYTCTCTYTYSPIISACHRSGTNKLKFLYTFWSASLS